MTLKFRKPDPRGKSYRVMRYLGSGEWKYIANINADSFEVIALKGAVFSDEEKIEIDLFVSRGKEEKEAEQMRAAAESLPNNLKLIKKAIAKGVWEPNNKWRQDVKKLIDVILQE